MNNIIKTSELDVIKAISGKRVLVVCHVNPDGDALGSAFALSELVSLSGGQGKVITPSPIPSRLEFISGGVDCSYVTNMEKSYDVIMSVDVASTAQLGDLAHLADIIDISVDHHEKCTPFCPCLLDSEASATGEIVFRLGMLMKEHGLVKTLSPAFFKRCYAAIVSDTGNFKYSNTTEKTFEIAAACLKEMKTPCVSGHTPVDSMSASEISAAFFDKVTRKDIAASKLTYDNMSYICNGRVAFSNVTAEQLEIAGLCLEDMGAMVDCIRAIDGTILCVAMKPSVKDGEYKISSRSNGDFDVASFASKFGGGGHKKAAGFSIKAENSAAALKILEDELNRELDGGTNAR